MFVHLKKNLLDFWNSVPGCSEYQVAFAEVQRIAAAKDLASVDYI